LFPALLLYVDPGETKFGCDLLHITDYFLYMAGNGDPGFRRGQCQNSARGGDRQSEPVNSKGG